MSTQNKKDFGYWGSLEQFYDAPEFKDTKDREFLVPPEKEELTGMQRRSFLKIMGASILMATTACSRRPVEKVIPYVNRPLEIVPGVATWYASTCQECSSGCGILVKNREGRPIKLEGNESHPLNKGGLCARGQASLLNLYDLDRIKSPLLRTRENGAVQEISWDQLDADLVKKLQETAQKGQEIVFLTGANSSPSAKKLMDDFLKLYPNSRHVVFEPTAPEEIELGQELSFGQKLTPRYRFDKAKVIVSFGADFLGTWLSPTEFTKQFSKARRVEDRSHFVAFESVLSVTGTNADDYAPVRPGDELAVALALLSEVLQTLNHSLLNDSQVKAAISSYGAGAVEELTGVKADLIRKTALALIKNRSAGLVVGGAAKARNGVALQVVVNLLNAVLENDGVSVDYSYSPSNQSESSHLGLLSLIGSLKQGRVGALIIQGVNPVYSLPLSLGFTDLLKKVPLVAVFAGALNETTDYADYVCAESHYLEAWADALPQKGLYSLAQPAINPLYSTRSFQEALVKWVGGQPDFYTYLRNFWQQNVYSAGQGDFETFWQKAVQAGFFDSRNLAINDSDRLASSRTFNTQALRTVALYAPLPKESFGLAVYPSVAMGDGRSANNAWLQELPDPVSRITWDNYLSIAPATAKKLSLKEGDVVSFEVEGVQVKIPVHLQPKLHEKTLLVAAGYGRTKAGQVGSNIGVDVNPLIAVADTGFEWGGRAVSRLDKLGSYIPLASTQISHAINQDRDIIKEMDLEEAQGHHESTHHGEEEGEEHATMWPLHKFPGYRWGMTIDLNACTGCASCVIGCQAENNIPVVGKDLVIQGREMHWMRIDRYYKGGEDNPNVSYQPMLCQHCENAPCETVCPVLATVHDSEGLNVMVYNRCVGTRYCANNCPYKVRRFNFFNYSKQYQSPLNMVLNPEVTTRGRGVMEKCTFCLQRIRTAKDAMRDTGQTVADGSLKTACQQSCPSDAITFGNTNDPNSRVSQLRKSQRSFLVLDEINTKPQVTYLAKVRNNIDKVS